MLKYIRTFHQYTEQKLKENHYLSIKMREIPGKTKLLHYQINKEICLDYGAETRCNVWYFFILFPGGPLSTTTWYWLDGTSPKMTLTLPWTRRTHR